MKNIIFIGSVIFMINCALFFIFQNEPITINKNLHKRKSLVPDSIPELHLAVLNRDIKKVKYLLQTNNDVTTLDSNGETALMYVCKSRTIDFEIITVLLEYGSDILYKNSKTRNSAISICIDSAKLEVILFLLDRLTPEQKEILGTNNSYLASGITAGEPEIVKQLIPYANNINSRHIKETSLLEFAIRKAVYLRDLKSSPYNSREYLETINVESAVETIDVLLSNGAIINKSTRFSDIVYEAIQLPSALRLLVENGLDSNKPLEIHPDTHNLLDFFLNRIASTDRLLVEGEEEVELTTIESLKEYLEVLDLMIEKGVNNPYGNISPYQALAVKGINRNSLKLIELLLSQERINADFIDQEGKTLLMKAQELGAQKMIELLMKNGTR